MNSSANVKTLEIYLVAQKGRCHHRIN